MQRRVLLKLSGEAFGGDAGAGLDPAGFEAAVDALLPAIGDGVEIAVVVGGGNLARGRALRADWLPRPTADAAGMLATVMNGMLLGAAFRSRGHAAEVFTPWPTGGQTRLFSAREALDHLDGGGVAILAGGTGNPFFSTDTCAALRALELGCDEVLKGTRVDGVYSADPETDPKAVRYDRISYTEVLERGLEVMDGAAVALCREHRMPIRVFHMEAPGALAAALRGEPVGTVVHPDDDPDGGD